MDERSQDVGAKDKLLDALFEIAELSSQASDLASFFPAVHRIIDNLLPAENFYVALYHELDDSIELVYLVDQADPDLDPSTVPSEALHRGLTGYLLRSGDPLLLSSDGFRELAQSNSDIDDLGPDAIDWLGIPLKRDNAVIGAMVVQSYDSTTRYSEADKALLTFVARQVVNTLERIRHRELLEQQILERTQALQQNNLRLRNEVKERERAETFQSVMLHLSELSNSNEEPQFFFQQVHEQVSRLIDARNFYIAMLADAGTLNFPYFVDEQQRSASPRQAGRGLTEYVMHKREPALVTKKVRDMLLREKLIDPEGTKAFQWLGAPLIVDDVVVGAIAVQSYDPAHRYRKKDVELIQFVSRSVANAIGRRRHREALEAAKRELEEKVAARTRELEGANLALRQQMQEKEALAERHRHDALHDPLTGLANRAFFTSQLNRVLKSRSRFPNRHYVVAFIDLDRFKIINDSMGHLAGDQLLREVSERLQSCVREADMLARLGGDEFVILFDSVHNQDEISQITDRIIHCMHQPFSIQEQQVFSGCSVGVAQLGRRYEDASEVLRDADTAMYQAKARGRGQVVYFDDGMREQLVSRFSLQNALRSAVDNNKLAPVFQPVFSLPQKRLCGFEVLARWPRMGGGELAAELFLEAAEETGIIVDIDRLMIRHACRQLRLWSNQRTGQPLFVSVNVSARSLQNQDFISQLLNCMQDHDLASTQLLLEIRESALLAPSQGMADGLSRLIQAGVGLVLDHFGAGSATLSILMEYNFKALKMSPHFLKQTSEHDNGKSLLQSVLALSHHLNIPLIAHGVEDEQRFMTVKRLGFSFAQGDYLSPPLALAQAELMLCA
ncbi:EAL domain-containing protein [Gallaecimonas sp. GXIMD1310]|uniref:EAL domain-containing protein n=1 Tax=Gallaecimonas sp. GXIMD1310 TaxID=3131926 RepID=UPI0032522BD3